MIAEQHKKEAIRNLEHETNKKKPEMAQADQSISGIIARQNSRFKKGMNFGVSDSHTEEGIKIEIRSNEESEAKKDEDD